MLTLPEIEKNYPESLRGFKRFILREYLQHKFCRSFLTVNMQISLFSSGAPVCVLCTVTPLFRGPRF